MLTIKFILTPDGRPILLSYNVRPTDPVTQALIPLLDDQTDLYDVFVACTKGTLTETYLNCDPSKTSVVVVAAAEGYPQKSAFHPEEVTSHQSALTAGFTHTLYKGMPTWIPKDAGWGEEGRRTLNFFHCGTRFTSLEPSGASTDESERRMRVAEARVVSVVGTGTSLEEATDMAYMGIESVRFQGMWYRKDVGRRSVSPPRLSSTFVVFSC